VLRITKITENGSPVILKLEGKILADWVNLLERECRSLIDQEKRVRLDFSGVSYMDLSGVEMMRQFPSGKVTIVNAPDFIADLLHRGGKS
jgi:anti-anti-sigma regulatory factor